MQLNSGVYKIVNIQNGDFYIGSSINLSLREKKVLDCVNKIDGNYLKISDGALEFLGGAR